jgi:hypothetical protein
MARGYLSHPPRRISWDNVRALPAVRCPIPFRGITPKSRINTRGSRPLSRSGWRYGIVSTPRARRGTTPPAIMAWPTHAARARDELGTTGTRTRRGRWAPRGRGGGRCGSGPRCPTCWSRCTRPTARKHRAPRSVSALAVSWSEHTLRRGKAGLALRCGAEVVRCVAAAACIESN